MQEIRWSGLRLKTFFTAGAILWIFSGLGVFVLPGRMHNLMYPLSMIIGAANALMMVCLLHCMAQELQVCLSNIYLSPN